MNCLSCGKPKTLIIVNEYDDKNLKELFCRSPICLTSKLLYLEHTNRDNFEHNNEINRKRNRQIFNLKEEVEELKSQLKKSKRDIVNELVDILDKE